MESHKKDLVWLISQAVFPPALGAALVQQLSGFVLAHHCAGTPWLTQKMNRPQFQWGSLIILSLMLQCVSMGLWRGVRCEVSGGLLKATQFWKLEKSITKTEECLCTSPACWSNAVYTDVSTSCPACESKEGMGIITWFTPFGLL
jgi:hypothetical protein